MSQSKRFVGTIQEDETILRFVNSHDAPRLAELGTSCPDHFLRTKIKPLYVAWNPQTEDVAALKQALSAGLVQYRKDYTAYYEQHKHADSPTMPRPEPNCDFNPRFGHDRFGQGQKANHASQQNFTTAPSK